MELNQNIKNIERRIKELAKEYEAKGYKVVMSPGQSDLPDFLQGFEPDLMVVNSEESVIIEVKSRQDVKDLDKYNLMAEKIAEKKDWRFELVFTNTLAPFIEKSTYLTLGLDDIKQRLNDVDDILKRDQFQAAFLLCWSTLEAAMRLKVKDEDHKVYGKPTSSIIKTLFSLGLINQYQYQQLDRLSLTRNNLIHGFQQQVDRGLIDTIVNLISYLIGESIESKMHNWLESLDLENYDDIHSLYMTTHNKSDYGMFNYREEKKKIIISAGHVDEELKLDSDKERKQFENLIEKEYMDGMSADSWYEFHKSMGRED